MRESERHSSHETNIVAELQDQTAAPDRTWLAYNDVLMRRGPLTICFDPKRGLDAVQAGVAAVRYTATPLFRSTFH